MNSFHMIRLILFSLATALLFLPTHAAEVPSSLPDPDGKPGDVTKPVKVYILAGQSNMVGMGNLSGARNVYDGVYLSSNPDVPGRPLQIYKVGTTRLFPWPFICPVGKRQANRLTKGSWRCLNTGFINCAAESVRVPTT